MRLVLFIPALFILIGCGHISDYDPAKGKSPSSYDGSAVGIGVQTNIWSNNPSQKTLTSDSQYGP